VLGLACVKTAVSVHVQVELRTNEGGKRRGVGVHTEIETPYILVETLMIIAAPDYDHDVLHYDIRRMVSGR